MEKLQQSDDQMNAEERSRLFQNYVEYLNKSTFIGKQA
jgi:hypothetical protein